MSAIYIARALNDRALEKYDAMNIPLEVRRLDGGFFVSSHDVVGLQMWQRDAKRIAELLPARARRLLSRNHHIDAKAVRVDAPEGNSPAEALLGTSPRLVAVMKD